MIAKKHFTASILVKSVAAINMLGNLLAVALTLIFFAVLIQRLSYGAPVGPIFSKIGFFLAVTAFVVAFVAPINIRLIWSLVREVKQRFARVDQGPLEAADEEGLQRLVGKLMRLPVKLAGTNLVAWILAALVV